MENSEGQSGPKSNSLQTGVLVAAVVLLVGGVGYFLLTKSSNNQTQPDTSAVPTQADENLIEENKKDASEEGTEGAMMDKGEIKEFAITGSPFAFSKKEVRVNKGDRVKIVFTSTAGTHDWGVDEFNARTEVVNAGETSQVEFVVSKAGTFEYYCSVGTHRQMGMVGKLIVE